MSTVSDLLFDTLNEWLLGTYRASFNRLENPVDAATGNLNLTNAPRGLGIGSFVSIDDELCYVDTVNESARTLVVVRGIRGSTPATHDAGAIVEMNPRYPRFVMRRALRSEITSWPNSLYRVDRVAIDVATDAWSAVIDQALNLQDVIHVLDINRDDPGGGGRKVQVLGWRPYADQVELGSLEIQFQSINVPGTYHFLLARRFNIADLSDLVDLQADIGLTPGMEEICQLGIAWRLVTGREARRIMTEVQGESRRAEEVPVQASATFGKQLRELRNAAISEEAVRLLDQHGLRGG